MGAAEGNALMAWIQQHPNIAIALAVVLGLLLLYMGRPTVHRLLRALARFLSGNLRLLAAWFEAARRHVRTRNEARRVEVSMAGFETQLRREFGAMDQTMARELEVFPEKRRELNELIACMEEEYRDSVAVPPLPTEWGEATTAVTGLRERHEGTTATLLGGIGSALRRAQARAFRVHQMETRWRHRRLQRMLPHWKKVQSLLASVDGHVSGLQTRSQHLEQLLEHYEALTTQRASETHRLRPPYLVRFLVAAGVLVILGMVAVVNTGLLSYPMREFVGAYSFLGPWHTADVAAVLMGGLALLAGLVMSDSVGLTRLMPPLAVLDQRLRYLITAVAGGLLLVVASLGAGLGYLHQAVLLEVSTLSAELAGMAAASEPHGVAVVSHTLLGFVLPLLLAFTAIPLQTLLQNLQVVLGDLVELVLALLTFLMRLLARLVRAAMEVGVRLYDLVIFIPLWLEARITAWRNTTD